MSYLKGLFGFGMLSAGTLATLSKKWQNSQTSKGLDGVKTFSYPWTQTLIMFSGEAVCLLLFLITYIYLSFKISKYEDRYVPLGTEESKVKAPNRKWWSPFLFLFSASLDLIGTTFGNVGLLFTYASVYQMLRGSVIVFSGILSVLILKRKLYFFNWLGIFVTSIGLLTVGLSSLLSEEPSVERKTLMLGNVLIVVGQLANALQYVIEEMYLKKLQYHPLVVVGSEGFFGIFMMIGIVLPILYFLPGSDNGRYENSLNAAVMIYNNHILLLYVLIYWLCIPLYNFCGLSVAKTLTTIHRTLLDALSTLCVWVIQLILYYVSKGRTGEMWDKYSYIQLIGFVLIVLGTLIHHGILKIPKVYYPPNNNHTHTPSH